MNAVPDQVRAEDHASLSLPDIVATIRRRFRLLAGVTALVAVVSAGVLLTIPNKYTATLSIIPEASSGANSGTGQLAGLAAFAGININLNDAGARSPRFYVAVLSSRPVRYAVLNMRLSTERFGIRSSAAADSVSILDLVDVEGNTQEERLWRGARQLARMTLVTADPRTGIIDILVKHESPVLSAAIANAYAENLIRFNREVRQSRARATRRFVEERVRQAAADLAASEQLARAFLERNRQYQNSPTLVFEFGRLQRTLALHQELDLDLRRRLDAARIAEVDDVPALTVIEPAIVPVRKSSPRRTLWLIIIVGITSVALATVVVTVELMPDSRDTLARLLVALSPRLARRLSIG